MLVSYRRRYFCDAGPRYGRDAEIRYRRDAEIRCDMKLTPFCHDANPFQVVIQSRRNTNSTGVLWCDADLYLTMLNYYQVSQRLMLCRNKESSIM